MKRFSFVALLLLFLVFVNAVRAQFSVGLRPSLSTYGGFDDRRRAEISLMTGTFGEHSRLEFDFGWGHPAAAGYVTLASGQQVVSYLNGKGFFYSATALYQWRHKILWRLYYYTGLGLSASIYDKSGLDILGVSLQLGLEFRLKIPVQITLDYRPVLDVLDGLAYYHTIGLGVRYQFRSPEPEPEPKFLKKWKQKLFGN